MSQENIMSRTIVLSAVALGICLASPGAAFAQTAQDLVGTWSNVRNVSIRPDGSKVDIFGPKGTGMAIFTSNGRFAIVNINPDTPKFAGNNRAQGTAEENKAATLGAIALYGTYSVANKAIVFKVEGSSFPNWTGTNQQRSLKSFTKDEFTWSLPASVGGTAEVSWKRLK